MTVVLIICFIIIIGGSVAMFIWGTQERKAQESELEKTKKIQDEKLNTEGVVISSEYTLAIPYYRFIADDVNKNVYIADSIGSASMQKIPYSKIIGFDIFTDSQVSGGIGRAIVGGVIAGGPGAIVGAQTAKKKIQSYKAIIYIENISNPKYELSFVDTEMRTDNYIYRNAVIFAENINATIKAIISCKKTEAEENSNYNIEITGNQNSLDTKEQLKKLKELYSEDLITQEEYEIKKKQILGIYQL